MSTEDATPHSPMPVSPMETPKTFRNRPTLSAEAPNSSDAYKARNKIEISAVLEKNLQQLLL